MNRFKGVVIASIHIEYFRTISGQFFNINAGTKAFAFSGYNNYFNRIIFTQSFNFLGNSEPCRAVKSINRWMVKSILPHPALCVQVET